MRHRARQAFNGLMVAVLLSAIGCTSQDQSVSPPAPPHPDDFSWGSPTNGLQVGLSFVRYETTPSPALVVRCAVRNVSDHPLKLISLKNRQSRWKGSPPLDVTLTGVIVHPHWPTVDTPVEPAVYEVLMPGQSWEVQTQFVFANWDLPPGSSPRLKLALQGDSPEGAELAEKQPPPGTPQQWFGEVFSGPVDVTVPQ